MPLINWTRPPDKVIPVSELPVLLWLAPSELSAICQNAEIVVHHHPTLFPQAPYAVEVFLTDTPDAFCHMTMEHLTEEPTVEQFETCVAEIVGKLIESKEFRIARPNRFYSNRWKRAPDKVIRYKGVPVLLWLKPDDIRAIRGEMTSEVYLRSKEKYAAPIRLPRSGYSGMEWDSHPTAEEFEA